MRRLVVLFLSLIVVIGSPFTALAQDASPDAMGPSLLSQMGLPEFRITVADGAVQAPTEIAAGEVLVVLDNQMEFPVGVSFLMFPPGTSEEDMMMVLGPPPDMASPEADASPAAEGGEEEMGPPPPLFYEIAWGGGVFAPPGAPAETVVTLTPGEWLLASDPESGMAPVKVQVTEGDGGADAAGAIAADGEVELKNFQFIIPETVMAGPQIWKVSNSGDQPHEMFLTKTPRRLTLDEVAILLELPEDELPPEGMPNPAEFQDVGGVAPISKDHDVYIELNLEPGAYVAVCFMPDKETGMPHAMKGMVVVFEVAEEGMEVEPPSSPVPMEDHDMATPTT